MGSGCFGEFRRARPLWYEKVCPVIHAHACTRAREHACGHACACADCKHACRRDVIIGEFLQFRIVSKEAWFVFDYVCKRFKS
eukprot:365808-Chlamydomonas_euryale.AAC.13